MPPSSLHPALPAPALERPRQPGWLVRYGPGLAWTGAIAWAALLLSRLPWLQQHGLGALTLAIVLGMVLGNTVYPRLAATAGAGVGLSKQELLRLGIILYGLRLTFQDIGHVGWAGLAIDALMLASTFGLASWLGPRVFGLEPRMAMLIGAGSSICGAAAVMASAPVLRARSEQVAVAVATVVVFGTLAMFLYPVVFELSAHWPGLAMTPDAYGVFAGSTIHEVAQVVVAGRAAGEQAGATAVIEKMVRVMMLAPFLIGLSAWLARRDRQGQTGHEAGPRTRITIPWFALGFVALAGLNSLAVLPDTLREPAVAVDDLCLAMAMAGLGLCTHVSAIRRAGLPALALAALLFLWLVGGGLLINTLLCHGLA